MRARAAGAGVRGRGRGGRGAASGIDNGRVARERAGLAQPWPKLHLHAFEGLSLPGRITHMASPPTQAATWAHSGVWLPMTRGLLPSQGDRRNVARD